MALTTIQQAALTRAVAFLNAAKVSFIVLDPGTKDFVAASDDMRNAKVQMPAKRTIVNDFTVLGYVEALKNLTDGQSFVLCRADHPTVFPDNKAWRTFRASANSVARRMFGTDGYVGVNDSERVEIMRVGS